MSSNDRTRRDEVGRMRALSVAGLICVAHLMVVRAELGIALALLIAVAWAYGEARLREQR